jgi:hypothetical protein
MTLNTLEQIRSIDPGTLTDVVRQDQSSPAFEILQWQVGPIGHVVMNPMTGGLFRFSGLGRDPAGTREDRTWSVLLKILIHPGGEEKEQDQQAGTYWKREILACQSCLLEGLPGPLTAPRCYGVIEKTNQTWIWMEYIIEAAPRRWEMDHFAFAARELSQFNAFYLNRNPLPDAPWLSRGFHQLIAAEDGLWHSLMNPDNPQNSWKAKVVQTHFSWILRERILEVWAEKERLLSALDRLPQVFCHNDYHRRNLMIRSRVNGSTQNDLNQLVGVDWNFSGIGAVGSDLGQLVGMSLFFFERDPADAEELLARCFEAYQAGLASAGLENIALQARLGCLISIALWPGFVLPSFAHGYTEMEPFRGTAEAQFGRSEGDMVAGWAELSEFCMDCAGEARQILAKMD